MFIIDWIQAVIFLFYPGVSVKDLSIFYRSFSELFTSGIPLNKIVIFLREKTGNGRLKNVAKNMEEKLKKGETIASAFEKETYIFSNMEKEMIKAGEKTGRIEETLNSLADYFDWKYSIFLKISEKLAYPIFVLILAIFASNLKIFIPENMLPHNDQLFISKFIPQKKLSPKDEFLKRTKTPVIREENKFLGVVNLRNLSKVQIYFINTLGPIFIMIFSTGFIFAIFKHLRHIKIYSYIVDYIKLFIPIVGSMSKKFALSSFCYSYASAYTAGMELRSTLENSADSSGNLAIAHKIRKCIPDILKGESISKKLESTKLFPPMLIEMLAIGEETGKFDEVLRKSALKLQAEAEMSLKLLINIITFILLFIVILFALAQIVYFLMYVIMTTFSTIF